MSSVDRPSVSEKENLDQCVSRAAQFGASRSRTNEDLQRDLDEWLHDYNYERTHQGKMCYGRTPMQTLIDGKEEWHDKIATLNN